MKDRFRLDGWPDNWVQKVIDDFPKLSRETRIFLAKWFRVFAEMRINERKGCLSGTREAKEIPMP